MIQLLKNKRQGDLPADTTRGAEQISRRLGDPPDLLVHRVPLSRARNDLIMLFLKQLIDFGILSDSLAGMIQDPLVHRARNPLQAAERIASSLPAGTVTHTRRMKEVVSCLLAGDLILLASGEAVSVKLPPRARRPIERPDVESSIRGPQESFVEHLDTNMALIRARLREPGLRVKPYTLGRRSNTSALLVYVHGIADPDIVREADRRLSAVDIDSVHDMGTLVDLIEDSPFGLWPQLRITQRPDSVVANLVEGRFVILLDGSPFALVAPVMFWQSFQTTDDYVGRFMVMSWVRSLRMLALFLALTGPALYVAIATFHLDLLPPVLAIALSADREAVPFPAALEAFIMKIVLDLLTEAGLRLPRAVGPAVSIVGALILGDAAVAAGLASSGMVIVIAGTAIAGFAIPDISVAETVRYIAYFLILLAAIAGLFGLSWGLLLILIGMVSQRSFGIPYTYPLAPGSVREMGDMVMRIPWWLMPWRPRLLATDTRRLGRNQYPRPGRRNRS